MNVIIVVIFIIRWPVEVSTERGKHLGRSWMSPQERHVLHGRE